MVEVVGFTVIFLTLVFVFVVVVVRGGGEREWRWWWGWGKCIGILVEGVVFIVVVAAVSEEDEVVFVDSNIETKS